MLKLQRSTTLDDAHLCSSKNFMIGNKKAKSKSLHTLPVEKADACKIPLYKRLTVAYPKNCVLNNSMQAEIVDSWRLILQKYDSDHCKIGLEIYARIFKECPELRDVFYIPEQVENLNDYLPFHRSGKLFASVIDLCVRNIGNLETEMGAVLTAYGRRHYYRRKQGFRLSYFTIFDQSILDFIAENITDSQRAEKILGGWYLLISFIRNKMANGFELEKQNDWELRRRLK
ncbi:unnamed protein product [Thelazia callipaeda]|uniref:GLOBIN domain-containing protein n=1 Tax=Thelazia callipaeda TaxID=103827 RepID=A0A0N5CNR1_THECL|nr:unnamed protein product [Thelazia callipaeda]